MWPWGHAAVGYFVFLAYGRLVGVDWKNHHFLAAVVAVFATQVPDLIDKPLAWWFHVLPSGRSLAHSLFAVILIPVAFWLVVRRLGYEELAVTFFLGYLSHPIADSWALALAGRWNLVSYFLYPLTPAPDYGNEGDFVSHFAQMQFTPYMWAQIALAVLAVGFFLGIEYRYQSGYRRVQAALDDE